ncbi:hypothetical protein SFRURICE_016682 [Spodoptera frugiperda]|nr:hypothetical protein SFRURICE_016682 [Spodoptera frugiperda]
MAGRTIGLPAAAAFAAATESVPPPHMHQDHMFNFLDAGADYYLNHIKKTGRNTIEPEDLTEKFEMGANTFSIELGEAVRLPLRLPDETPGLGLWMAAGGKVVAFDPAPTLVKGLLTTQRIKKGDELRLQRLKDEMTGESAGDAGEEDDEEAGGEGEEKPEPEPEAVPPESCPVLIVAASPGEFIDKLTAEEVLVPALEDAAMGKYMDRLSRSTASVRARLAQNENYFIDQPNRDNQDAANAVMGIVVHHIEPYTFWKPELLDAVLKYGDRLYTMSIGNASAPPQLKPKEMVKLEIEGDVIGGDIKAGETGSVNSLKKAITSFFTSQKYGVLCAKGYCVGIWKGADDKSFVMLEPHAVGPAGKTSPAGAATLVVYSNVDELADTFRANVEGHMRPGDNKFSISSVKVFWEFSKLASPVTPQGAVPDEGYEWKVLTAYVETARGRTILRGTRPPDLMKKTVDEVISVACQLFTASLGSLGYEFRPGEDVLLPLQVLKRFVLGVNYVRYNLEEVFSGKLEQKEPTQMTVRCALERFFESHTHGILWSVPHAVCVWRVAGAPAFYMFEPHACGPTGLRVDAMDDGAACVLTFTSPKLMAFAYLQNVPVVERPKHDFQLYAMSITVQPIKKLGGVEPPIVRAPPGVKLVPATSKVGIDGSKRRAEEKDRKHPPGSATCMDAQRAAEKADKEQTKLKGQRNTSGWLVLNDGTQFMSAMHSIACRKFSCASRGCQALACSVMAVAMSRVEDVCRWCSSTLDQILESGDQLYQDSYLHFHPETKILNIEQILRKFYTPGNCVCRVVVYKSRHRGVVDVNLVEQIGEFFREERAGVFVAGKGDFAVALFRTPRDVLNSNKKLKCEMAQLHTQHTEAIEARDRLQFVVDGFSQCSSEYEQTLHDKAHLEQQLHEANNQISHLETINHNITASMNNSLFSELVSARASQSQHLDLNPLTIDLTCESDSCHSSRTLCYSNKKLKKYIKINKFITKTNRLVKRQKFFIKNNLQLEIDHLTAKLHTMTNKYSASEKQMREYMLAMDELVRSQSQENPCEKCDSSNVLPACTVQQREKRLFMFQI